MQGREALAAACTGGKRKFGVKIARSSGGEGLWGAASVPAPDRRKMMRGPL